ncbi:MAG: DUF5711 family protein [Eubacteriales bacterium]|nr:DUF5711 family protein [Eubacteriales bacterium]
MTDTKQQKNAGRAKNTGSSRKGTASGGRSGKSRMSVRRRRVIIQLIAGIGAVILVIAAIWLFLDRRTFRDYEVESTSSQEDTVSTNYVEIDGKVFRYSAESASMVNDKQEILWTTTYDMQNPIADICDKTAVVADKGGTSMTVFNTDGVLGNITTSYNIEKVRVAGQGVVAAILDGGDDTWINFYASDGTLIAENQTRVDEPGYPMDIAVSPDGLIIMVTYQFVEGSKTNSYVAFYNFGTVGQSQIDNIVSGYTYEGVVIPQIQYLSSGLAVAFRDDGFTIYEGKQIPKESKSVQVDKEIVSTFYDEKHIGLVFKDEGEDKTYKLEIYGTNGNKMYERSFNIPYTEIKMTDGYIVMYNSNQVCVVNDRGKEKFNGTIDEGTIRDFFKIGWNRYMLILDNGVSVIKLT